MILCLHPPSGEIGGRSAAELRRQLLGLDPRAHVLLDLTSVSSCDAAGIAVLRAARARQRAGGGSLEVVGVSARVARLLSDRVPADAGLP